MKKRNVSKLFCMAICVSLLTGCGGEYAGITEGDIVSGSAVSGETVSGDAIREKTVSGPAVKEDKDDGSREGKTDMSSHRFCTDTNLYYVNEDHNKIMQARVDGTHRKCIRDWTEKEAEYEYITIEVIVVDKNWLYYVVDSFDEKILYRVPIEKDAEGQDVIGFPKEEELVKEDMVPEYADSDYYFYSDIDSNLIKYDLKRKKKVSEEEELFAEYMFRVNDHYLCVDSDEVYVQKVGSTRWKKIYDVQSDLEYYSAVQNNRAVFIAGDVSEENNDWCVNIKRCDEKAATDFVTWEQMVRNVTEVAGVKTLDVCHVKDYFWQEGRLYIQMQAGWMEEGLYHMEYMMISQGENEDGSGSGLRYEKELTECMNSHVKEQRGSWSVRGDDGMEETIFVEHMAAKDANCIAMTEGKAYLSLYDHEKDKGRLGCYDLDTGKFEWIGKNSAAFYKLACDLDPEKYDRVFDDEEVNRYAGWEWPPSKDEEYVGRFTEG